MWQILYPNRSCPTSRIRKKILCILHFISILSESTLGFWQYGNWLYGISKAKLNSCDNFSGKNLSEICERLASSRACALVFCKSTWCHPDRQTNVQKRNGYEFSSWCCELAGKSIFSSCTMCSSSNWLAYGMGLSLDITKNIFHASVLPSYT